MSRKTNLALCWDTETFKPIAIRYRTSDNEILQKSTVDMESIVKMLEYHMDRNQINEMVLDGIKITKR